MKRPSVDAWIEEIRSRDLNRNAGMFLVHNGVVRVTPRAQVREGVQGLGVVKALTVSYDKDKADNAVRNALNMEGITDVKVWINVGNLNVGDDIMLVLVAGDIRPHVINALQTLVDELKNNCITEQEFLNTVDD